MNLSEVITKTVEKNGIVATMVDPDKYRQLVQEEAAARLGVRPVDVLLVEDESEAG